MFQREENALELTNKTISLMEKQGYSLKKTRYHRSILNQLVEFCDQRYDGKYSAYIGLEFIRHISQRDPSLSLPYFKRFEAEVRRLNHFLEEKTERYAFSNLEHYEHSGFDHLVEEYKGYLHETLKSDLDVRMRTRALARFFILLEAQGIYDLEKLESKDIYSVYIDTSDKDMFRKVVRGFLKYAYTHKLLKTDYSAAVPTFTRHVPVPSVYTKEECVLSRVFIASLLRGHWKLPRSNRLYRRTNPSPSQYRALIRSFRFPQKRNRFRLNGSNENSSFTRSANPSIPFLRSVYPQARYICSACVKSFNMRTPGV